MFRPDNPLLPNHKHIPIGYHGRASSILISGTALQRPSGQTRDDEAQDPVLGPSRRLDYKIEVRVLIGRVNELGTPITIDEAASHVFRLCLANDWSAPHI